MATRHLLAELAQTYCAEYGVPVRIESVGGVDAARRIAAGERFDFAVLASDAVDRLIAAGHLVAASRTDVVRSPVAVAVRSGAAHPDIGSEAALQAAVLAARAIGYSTGPSGNALLALFERWGLADRLCDRLCQAPPGVPVAKLVASGEVDLGFQQLAELQGTPGVQVLGPLPPGCAIESVFTAACCTTCAQPQAVQAWLDYLRAPQTAEAKRRHGMQPA